MREPTLKEVQKELHDLRALIPPHLLLKHPLNGKAPPAALASVQPASVRPATPITLPPGFGPYEWFGDPIYGRANDGRACWDHCVLGSFYNDKATFKIYILRSFSEREIQVLSPPQAIHHGGIGRGANATFLWGFGEQGTFVQQITGASLAFGDEGTLSAQNLPATIQTMQGQIAAQQQTIVDLQRQINELKAAIG